jgi:hypothetical protein
VARNARLVPLLKHEQARIYTSLDFEAEPELNADDQATALQRPCAILEPYQVP